jgi:hypothetical protein
MTSSASPKHTLVVSFASTNVNVSGAFTTIGTAAIPQITEVRLYEETVDHANEHVEVPAGLPSMVAAVGDAVSNPTHVEKSYSDSYVYVSSTSTDADGYPLRVPVKIVSGTSARVKTYFFGKAEDEVEIVYGEASGK